MDNSPLISIIIPVYNAEKYIFDTFNSALKQTYTNIEYIVVDDCGADRSIEIVQEITRSHMDKNIRVVGHNLNKGLSEARNTGLRESKGEYVFFMDSDDQIPTDCIEVHFKAIQKSNADFTDGNIQMVGVKHSNFSVYKEEQCVEDNDKLLHYFNGFHVCGCNKLLKRVFLLDNNLYFKKDMLYEDVLWTYQLSKAAKKYVTIPTITYMYIVRPGSITQSNDKSHIVKQFKSFMILLKCMENEFKYPSSNRLIQLQSKWFNRYLLIIKSRLLTASLERSEQTKIFRELKNYNKYIKYPFRLVHTLSLMTFQILFTLPNILIRKIRN